MQIKEKLNNMRIFILLAAFSHIFPISEHKMHKSNNCKANDFAEKASSREFVCKTESRIICTVRDVVCNT